jgi:hypothetical protein
VAGGGLTVGGGLAVADVAGAAGVVVAGGGATGRVLFTTGGVAEALLLVLAGVAPLLLALAAAFELDAVTTEPLVPVVAAALTVAAGLALGWADGAGEPLALGAPPSAVVPCGALGCPNSADITGEASAVTPPASTSTTTAATPAMTLRDGRWTVVKRPTGRPSSGAGPGGSAIAVSAGSRTGT